MEDDAKAKDEIAAFLDDLDQSEGWMPPSMVETLPPASPTKRTPLFVHHLPRELRFVGRAQELGVLKGLYDAGLAGMIAIVGIGGAGKSVLLDQFLRTIDDADGLLVWSFYIDEDVERFLSHAFHYVVGVEAPIDLRGRALGEKLCEALKTAGRVVLVLDGLERAQRDDGRLSVDAIRDVVERLALGWGRAVALVTTRLSLLDIQHYLGAVYREVRLGELSSEDAGALLGNAGVRGTEAERSRLAGRFGGHALTLSLLGTALARFYEGDPSRMAEIVGESRLEMMDEAGKLGRVLAYYERRLAPSELAVLQWMTALPRGATIDFLERFVTQGSGDGVPEALRGLDHGALHEALGRLLGLHLIQADTKGGLTEYGVHAAIKAYFYERMLTAHGAKAHEAAFRALTARPARARPVEKDELDRAEDVVFHVLRAGRGRDAYELYRRLLGYDHIGAKLGAYVLGERVVRWFFPEGDPTRAVPGLDATQRAILVTELGLFLRQLGELRKAAECHAVVVGLTVPGGGLAISALLHVAHDRLLQGMFREVRLFAEQARQRAGEDHEVERCAHLYLGAAHTCLGELDRARHALEAARGFGRDDLLLVTVRVDLNLRIGKLERAAAIAQEFRRRIATKSFHEDQVACDLLLAECAAALGNMVEAEKLLRSADYFATQSGWQHALCRIHRLRARAALREGDPRTAEKEMMIGRGIAERYGFGSLLIDLLVLRGELMLASDPASAITLGREAFRLATDHACRYRWGQTDAFELWGRAVARTGDRMQARVLLRQALQWRKDLGNVERTAHTEQAIAEL